MHICELHSARIRQHDIYNFHLASTYMVGISCFCDTCNYCKQIAHKIYMGISGDYPSLETRTSYSSPSNACPMPITSTISILSVPFYLLRLRGWREVGFLSHVQDNPRSVFLAYVCPGLPNTIRLGALIIKYKLSDDWAEIKYQRELTVYNNCTRST